MRSKAVSSLGTAGQAAHWCNLAPHVEFTASSWRKPAPVAGTWGPEVEALGGRIVITRSDGTSHSITYSAEQDNAQVREGSWRW